MKKHKFILIVIGLGVIFLLAAMYYNGGSGIEGESVRESKDGLDARIEASGKKAYVADTFKNIEWAILNTATDAEHESSLKQAMAIAKQNALAIRINDWFNQNCPDGSNAEAITESGKFASPNSDLAGALKQYRDYQYALSFSGKLNSFLAKEYNAAGHSSLFASFSAALSGQKFRNCPALSGKLEQMNEELNEFKDFADTWNGGIQSAAGRKLLFDRIATDRDGYNTQLLNYSYYAAKYQELKNQP
jgi:hypothetical protein